MGKNIDRQKVKKVIAIIIAVLSAIAGGITEASTAIFSNLLNL